jgi:hypothetical protein
MKLRRRWNHLTSKVMRSFGHRRLYPFDDKDIVRYLIGNLPDEHASRLEELYFCDPQFFAHIEAVESKLIHSIPSRGKREKALFAKKYLTVPKLRARLDAANPKWDFVSQPSDRRISRLRFPVYACVILALASVSFIAIFIPYRSRERLQTAHRSQTSATQPSPAGKTSMTDGVATLTLSPGLFRSARSQPFVLTLSDSVKEVSFTLLLPALRESTPLEAELLRAQTTKRVSVLTRQGIQPMRTGLGWTAHFSLPADVLIPGDYLLYLKPIKHDHVSVPIERYGFSVQ